MAYRVVIKELTTPLETLEEAEAEKAWREDMYPTTTHQIVEDMDEELPEVPPLRLRTPIEP